MNQHKRKKLKPVNVIDNRLLTSGVHYISIEKNCEFKAGQVIAIALNPNDEPRLYSIASGTNKKYISILFDIKPGGELTPPLSKVKSGDTVFISEPFGKFLCADKPATWIATGTGIAPFLSIIESGQNKNIKLLHGARTLDKFFFQEYLYEQLGDYYLRFCTTESNERTIDGRLTDYLKNSKKLPTNNKYYLCGSSQMVIDVREILISKGIPFDNIIAEIYF
ncbi:FAD-binding oxidoreductase [Carboxylicivirga marina]|uniref:Oxidoreductase n=1 Tax=Carboxylicivirga marina TaxID=2800988 RepID=A0ABS1HQ98_9BACT|nr:FAD-binding oxidoreductase [Carboxylicivirga marina]MBK3519854.1 oxidoreductase [Carboxylicivirga marina]